MSPSLRMPKKKNKTPRANSDSISSEPGWFSWRPAQLRAMDNVGREKISTPAHTSPSFQGCEWKDAELTFRSIKTIFILGKGVGVAFNPTRFKEKKTNRAASPPARQRSISQTVAVSSVSPVGKRTRRCRRRNSSLRAGDGQRGWGGSLCNWGM